MTNKSFKTLPVIYFSLELIWNPVAFMQNIKMYNKYDSVLKFDLDQPHKFI